MGRMIAVAEAAQCIGRSAQQVRHLLKTKQIRGERLGISPRSPWLVDEDSALAWAALEHKTGPKPGKKQRISSPRYSKPRTYAQRKKRVVTRQPD